MGKVTFDRLRLSVPKDCVSILKPEVITTAISGDGEPLTASYNQKSPFYYKVSINYGKRNAEIEFSGKALLDDYPSLINYCNIESCFKNISKCGVFQIDSTMAINLAYVKQCDVTCDIPSSCSIKELYNYITLKSSKGWCIKDITSNRFAIENTNTTKRLKCRLLIYDKEEEMSNKSSHDFLSSVTNREDQLKYFQGKCRFELNLQSIDRIRHYFNIEETKLTALINSNEDPIARFLGEALVDEELLSKASLAAGNLRDLEHLLLIALCDYDIGKLERLIRSMYGASRSIQRAKTPYLKIQQKLKGLKPALQSDSFFDQICCRIRDALARIFEKVNTDTPNLLRMYSESCDTWYNDGCSSQDVVERYPYAIYNVPFVALNKLE